MKTLIHTLRAALLALFTFATSLHSETIVEKWVQRYNGPGNNHDATAAVVVDGSGNVVVAGGSVGVMSSSDFYVAKYAASDGSLLWEKRYNGPASGPDGASAVALDSKGDVVVTGSSAGSGFFNGDYYTAKYSGVDGALLWEVRYNGPADGDDYPTAIAVDGDDNVAVTGYSPDSEGNANYYTAKYSAITGALLWEKRYNGPGNGHDRAYAIVVDGAGNVAVTGESVGNTTYSDYYTAKYASEDGALIWEKRYDGPWRHPDQAKSVAVDGSGNIVVTGSSTSSTGLDYYTAKYAAANGALLWEKRYDGSLHSGDAASSVAVDGIGNVIVTGSSQVDFYTAKYAAGNGALIWERRYNGTAGDQDHATGVAVDGSGNVVVCGSSRGSGSSIDCYTAKYAEADGRVLWEMRYNGPKNYEDDPSGRPALTPSGGVAVAGATSGDIGYDMVTLRYEGAGPLTLTTLGSTGGAVPGAGVAGSGVPAGAVWATLGVPSVNDAGQVAFLGKWKAGMVKGEGIFLDDALVVAKGGAVVKLGDPLLAPDGAVAWVATLSGAVKSAIFLDADGAGAGPASVVASTGMGWKKFTSVALGEDALAFTGTQGGRAGLWVWDRDTATLHLAAQVGQAVAGSTIKSITALVERPGSPGNGRGVEAGRVAFRLTLADKTTAIAVASQTGVMTIEYAEGEEIVGYGYRLKFGKLGLPTLSPRTARAAFLGTVKSGTGSADNVAIFTWSDSWQSALPAAIKGGFAAAHYVRGGIGSNFTYFSTLQAPVVGSDNTLAFIGTVAKDAELGVSAANDENVWATMEYGLTDIAREGEQPAGVIEPAAWKKFISLAITADGRPLFVASIRKKRGTELGLWATDSFGALRLLLREGEALGNSKVRKFSVLSSVRGSAAQTRSFNDAGSVVVHATDAKGAQHLLHIAVP